MVNEQWGVPVKHKGGLWFEFDEEIKVDKARAERDKIYADMGYIRFTNDYYEKVLGFEPEHYELAETPDRPSPRGDGVSENGAASLAVRLSDGQAGGLSPTKPPTVPSCSRKSPPSSPPWPKPTATKPFRRP